MPLEKKEGSFEDIFDSEESDHARKRAIDLTGWLAKRDEKHKLEERMKKKERDSQSDSEEDIIQEEEGKEFHHGSLTRRNSMRGI
jgi:hypothetical protein